MGQHHVELSFFISKPSIMFMLSGVCIADTVVWARERGIWLTKKLNVGLMLVMICLELCTSYIVVTTTFTIFSSNKSQNPRFTWKMAVKMEREREVGRERERCVLLSLMLSSLMCVYVESAGLGSICCDDIAVTWHSIPSVAPQQVQVWEHETGKEIIVVSLPWFMTLYFLLKECLEFRPIFFLSIKLHFFVRVSLSFITELVDVGIGIVFF